MSLSGTIHCQFSFSITHSHPCVRKSPWCMCHDVSLPVSSHSVWCITKVLALRDYGKNDSKSMWIKEDYICLCGIALHWNHLHFTQYWDNIWPWSNKNLKIWWSVTNIVTYNHGKQLGTLNIMAIHYVAGVIIGAHATSDPYMTHVWLWVTLCQLSLRTDGRWVVLLYFWCNLYWQTIVNFTVA